MKITNLSKVELRENLTLTISVHLAICTIIIGIGTIYFNFKFQDEPLIYWACLSSVALYGWLFYSWLRITGSIFDPYGLFLLAAILFNGGQVLLEVLGLNLEGILNNQFSQDTVLQSVYLVACCLSFFHLGALLCVMHPPKITKFARVEDRALLKVACGLFVLAVVPMVIQFYEAVIIVWSGGYGALYERDVLIGIDAYSNVLSAFIVPCTLFMLAGSDGRKAYIRLSMILVVSYSATQFFLGYRGWATMPLIAYAWLWHNTISPLPKRRILVLGGALLIFAFPVVASVRNLSGADKSFDNLIRALRDSGNPAVSVISEMGGSLRTVAHTLELVPSIRDFDGGEGYFYALLTIIPNIWGGVHPTVARGLPSRWLTETVEPIIAQNGGGLGYSFIAEAYLNFGWFGAPIILCLFGYLFARLVMWAIQSENNARIVMIASFISFSLYFARGELSGVVRQLTWYSFIPYFCVKLLASRSQKIVRL